MESHSLLPGNIMKMEPACEDSTIEISKIQGFDKTDNTIPATVKIEQPEVNVEYPGETIKTHPHSQSMESHRLLTSNKIKLERASEPDIVQSYEREIISEVQDFYEVDCKIPANVKLEQSEVYVDYPGDDMKMQHCFQSYRSMGDQPQMEKKMVFSNMEWKLIKEEQSDILCEDKSHRLNKIRGLTSCSIQEMSRDNTESRIAEDKTLTHHQEVSLIGTENGYTASQCIHMSENLSSAIGINTKICLTNENFQLSNADDPVKQSQISEKYLYDIVDYTSFCTQRIQPGDTPQISDVCDVTINVNAFSHRQKTHAEEESYECDVCDVSFIEVCKLKSNMRIHSGEKLYKCDDCGRLFLEIIKLNGHMRTHTGEICYKCEDCGASFTETGHLKCHLRTHTEEKPYKCSVCTTSFTNASTRKRHMRNYTGEKTYMCSVCAASFTCASNLKYHMRTHTGEKPYMCCVCAASFTYASKLKCHMRNHTGEKPYMCSVCAASFTCASNLKYHIRTHTGEKTYMCNVCAASFTCASNLKGHMRTHTGEKPYKCDVCAASFTKSNNLRRHIRIHTGEKPYKCDVCDASLTRAASLKHHMRTHTGEKPYKCDVCSASFSEASHLKRHLKTHTGEKPHKCVVCAASFAQSSNLRCHMRIHTGENSYR